MDAENCFKLRAYANRYHLGDVLNFSRQIIASNLVAVVQQKDFNELCFNELASVISMWKNQVMQFDI